MVPIFNEEASTYTGIEGTTAPQSILVLHIFGGPPGFRRNGDGGKRCIDRGGYASRSPRSICFSKACRTRPMT